MCAKKHPVAQSEERRGSTWKLTLVPLAGFIGRNLAHYIHTNALASTLRIVDKQLPQLASLAPEHVEACSEPNFLQADASRPQSLARIFDLPKPGQQFDYIFNCGGETRYSQDDQVYKLRSYSLSLNVAKEAAKRGAVKAFIELSTGQVYEPKRDPPRKETDKLKPIVKLAKWKLQAEEELKRIPNLPLVVLRLPNVYGPYTGKWLGTQLALARVWQDLEKEMKYLWSSDLRTATAHVEDVARACWAAAEWKASPTASGDTTAPTTNGVGDSGDRIASVPITANYKAQPMQTQPAIFNIVDSGNTNQATMASIIHDLFRIETGFQGTLINTFARLNLDYVVDDVNDETLDPWAELQIKAGIDAGSGPLTPFMEKELLKDHDLSMDGSKFVRTVGFEYVFIPLESLTPSPFRLQGVEERTSHRLIFAQIQASQDYKARSRGRDRKLQADEVVAVMLLLTLDNQQRFL